VPDRYGFNHLGDNVRCIDCTTGGPLGRWPEPKRATHAHSHHRVPLQRTPGAADTRSDATDRTEAIAMPTSSKGDSAKQVAIDILRQTGTPLPATEIAKQILASGRCAGLRGKTPEATISAMLAVGSKPGGPFQHVDKGTYTLADTASTSRKPAQPKQAAKKGSARKSNTTAKRRSDASRSTTKRTSTKRTTAKRPR
jgi:hypothetical protein